MSEGRASLAAGMPVTANVSLVKPLGAGGMGAVWLADHTALKTRVVVKFMLGGLDQNANAVKRFRREAEAAAQVKSPHVVQMLDHGFTDDGTPFIVMEHLEGHDLGKELEKGRVPPRKVISIVQQVAKALAKVHAAGLLHRDIKPDNIFLIPSEDGDDDFVKLLDFGIAKSAEAREKEENLTLDGETKTGQVVGTPYYMSPEQVTAQKTIDHRSDLWALGVVTFEALTGQRPFDGPSFGALAVRIATGTPTKPSEVDPTLPPALDAWFAKACAREPTARFNSAREMSDALRAVFEGVLSLPPTRLSGDSSGERRVPTPDPSGSGRLPTPTELASTVKNDTPDPSGSDPLMAAVRAPTALARSEGGTAPVAVDEKTEGSDEKRPLAPLLVLGAVAVAAIVALGVFMNNKMSSGASAEGSSTASTSAAKNASRPPPPVSATTAAPSATVEVASAAPRPSAVPSASASAAPVAVHGKPAFGVKPNAATSASARPEASAPPTGKPSASREPDVY